MNLFELVVVRRGCLDVIHVFCQVFYKDFSDRSPAYQLAKTAQIGLQFFGSKNDCV